MTWFWIAALALALAAGALVLQRSQSAAARANAPGPQMAVYRRALAEVDDLVGRDLLTQSELAATRAEVGRRLLRAAERREPPRRSSRPEVIFLAALAAPLLTLGLYLALGSPKAPDQPFRARLANWRADPERSSAPELAASLRAVAAERPTDPEPLERLAVLELSLGDPDAAAHALRQAILIAPRRADLTAMLGEILVFKARGVVDPDAQSVFRQTLALDPASATARYYLGVAAVASGDASGALRAWRSVLTQLAPTDPRRAVLIADIGAVERTGAPPSPEEPAPAQPELSRAIGSMVDSLAARLAVHPKDPAGWVRLVRAYGVLGESGKQADALAEARRYYAGRSDVLAQLQAASQRRP
jgi:cytochrome c-type biogenesis protein CcmH